MYWKNADDNYDNHDIDSRIEVMEFFKCWFSDSNWTNIDYISNKCVNEDFPGDNWNRIRSCATNKSEVGPMYLEMEQKVDDLELPLTLTPWIVIDGVFTHEAVFHLKKSVCDAYNGTEKPSECYESGTELVKPKVQLHYEPLNVKCKELILDELNPLQEHSALGIVDLELIPFGRAQNVGGTYQCENNDENCLATKIHACIIDKYYESQRDNVTYFLICSFGRLGWQDENINQDCVNEFLGSGLWSEINTCATNQEQANAVLKKMEDKVLALDPQLNHVPWVVINGLHDENGEKDLMQDICDRYYPVRK